MKIQFEKHLPYAALAVIVLILFYGIYFAKMLLQKRRGIATRQIGRKKDKSIRTVELLMGIATLGAPAAQLASILFGWNYMPADARLRAFASASSEILFFFFRSYA